MSEWPHVDGEEKYRMLFRSIDTGFCIIEVLFDDAGRPVDYIFLEANPAFEVQTGLGDAIGKRIRSLAPHHEEFWFETYGRIAKTGQPERFEHRADALGRWYSVYAFRVGPPELRRVAILFDDIKERKWAEAELRDSEERFRQFAEASSGALWIRNAATLAMEYASPAIATIFGVEPGALLGDVKLWAAAIVPEDRDDALEQIERARRGQPVMHEFRIHRPSDQTFRWIKNSAFPLRDANGSIKRLGGIFEDVTEAKLAIEHQGVLLAELQHRVRNIMAIIRSITTRTADNASNVREYADLMVGRVLALARVQALLTRAAGANVSIKTLVHDEVSVQAQHASQYQLDGPDIALSPKAAEILTLAVHELSTNALKYGALSAADGKINVEWSTFEKQGATWLDFNWVEEVAPARQQRFVDRQRRRGFGIELIEGRIPYELGGRGQVSIQASGARCHLEFPLEEGASILATDAPRGATVFGGALDVTGEPDLHGHRVLVVEDEYYIATDAARVLRGAGAEVIGPCPSEEAARAALAPHRPDAVVLDINLGHSPCFALAKTLRRENIPFLFLTGYDLNAIPEEFKDVARLEKPIQLGTLVGAVAGLLNPGGAA